MHIFSNGAPFQQLLTNVENISIWREGHHISFIFLLRSNFTTITLFFEFFFGENEKKYTFQLADAITFG